MSVCLSVLVCAVQAAALIPLSVNVLHSQSIYQTLYKRVIFIAPAKLEPVSVLISKGMYSLLTPILWVCGF